jgi:hypothetical protein
MYRSRRDSVSLTNHEKRKISLVSIAWSVTMPNVLCSLTEVFLNLTEVFPCFFLSCKANARVKLAKTGHCPHSSTLVVIFVVRMLFVLFYVLFVCKCVLPPGDNPTAVNTYIKYQVNVRITGDWLYLSQMHYLVPRNNRMCWYLFVVDASDQQHNNNWP